MSVLIKGVKMPEAGKRPLQVVVHSDGVVEYNSGDYGWKTTKACEVPTPHGPLIDMNEALHAFSELEPYRRAFGKMVLIEAEEGPK